MEVHIDIVKIVAETLEKYPLCFSLKREFENSLQTYLDGLNEAIEDAEKVGRLLKVKAEYEGYYETTHSQYERDSSVNDFEGIKRQEAAHFAEFRFFESALIWFNENTGKKRVASTAKIVQKEPLAFEESLKEPEKLPQLWKNISKIGKPFVSESGNLLEIKQPHAILMAFAQALLSKDKTKKGVDVREMYLILCRFFEVRPASRPDKIKDTHHYKDVLSDLTDCM